MCAVVSSEEKYLGYAKHLRYSLSDILGYLRSDKEDTLQLALSRILQFFSADHVFIGFLDNKANTLNFIRERVSDGSHTILPPSFFDTFSSHIFPWWTQMLGIEGLVRIDDTSRMPAEASAEQKQMLGLHIKSQLTVSTCLDEGLNGFIGLDMVSSQRVWNDFDIENLRIFSDVLSLVIEQERTRKQLKQSSEEALKNENKFRLIFEKLPIGVEVYSKDGHLLDINPKDMEIFGITREKALGSNLYDNPNIPQKAKVAIRKGKEADMNMVYDFDMSRKKGYYDWEKARPSKYIKAKSSPIKGPDNSILGHLFLVEDDTDAHLKNEQIKTSFAKLQLAVYTDNAFIWDFDLETGEINVDGNSNITPEYIKQLGIFKHSYDDGNSTFIDTIHTDDFQKIVTDGFQAIVEGKIDHFYSNFRRIYEEKTLWYICHVKTYKYNSKGKPVGVVCRMVDVTKLQETELELMQVKEANKLKAMFLANMSHEIRTPLNAIVGFSNVLAEIYPQKEAQELIEQINTNNDLLLELVHGVLDFSKLETGQVEYKIGIVDMKKLAARIAAQYDFRIKESIRFILDENMPAVLLQSDEEKIEQAILCLLNNANKFTKQGNITLSYRIIKPGTLRVEVSDTGIGIKKEYLDKIFNGFFKINPFSQGVGLGLPIAKSIIEKLGGSIGVLSEEGKGSTFWFTLPVR